MRDIRIELAMMNLDACAKAGWAPAFTMALGQLTQAVGEIYREKAIERADKFRRECEAQAKLTLT